MNLNVNKCGISDGLWDDTDSVCMSVSACVCVCVRPTQPYRLKEVPGGGPVRGGKGGGEPMAISGSWVKRKALNR